MVDDKTSRDAPNATDAKEPAKQSPAPLVFGTFAVFLAIIGSCAAYYLWPRGDRLGAIDLRAENATLAIDVAAGDKLTFRIDTITVGTKDSYPNSSSSRSNQVRSELEKSKITITATATGSDGAKASTECGAYAGKATTGSSDSDSVTSSGHPLDCVLEMPKAGSTTLTAKVTWIPKDVRHAILEVRREKAAK